VHLEPSEEEMSEEDIAMKEKVLREDPWEEK
jgi:hypothetical protein